MYVLKGVPTFKATCVCGNYFFDDDYGYIPLFFPVFIIWNVLYAANIVLETWAVKFGMKQESTNYHIVCLAICDTDLRAKSITHLFRQNNSINVKHMSFLTQLCSNLMWSSLPRTHKNSTSWMCQVCSTVHRIGKTAMTISIRTEDKCQRELHLFFILNI